MKNLNGYSKKILSIFSLLFLLSLFPTKLYSESNFAVYSDYYHIWDGNTINSTIYLTITTKSSPTVITSYTVTIPDSSLHPKVYLTNRNIRLEPTIERRDLATDLVLNLNNMPLSSSKPITLKIVYSTINSYNSLELTSSVNDTIPRHFSFTYPTSKGDVTWSSAPITGMKTLGNNIEIITSPPKTTKVSITMGSEIVYRYKINRNLINPSNEMIISEVSLPINNSFQHLNIEKILPIPDKAYKDLDGNYILQYGIAPDSNIELSIEGYIFMKKASYSYENIFSIEENKLWKITDLSLLRHVNRYLQDEHLNISETFSDINELTTSAEKEFLYKGIYKYVIENLKPNTLTIGSLVGEERLGGQDALLKQSLSTSEAYADAIVSLYRHFNIPSRLVIGYVTNISNYHPEGIYHYWAEYYDKEEKTWIIVDPFLEDYSKTSLWKREMKDHIALIYRYSNPNTPKLLYFSDEDLQIYKSNSYMNPDYDFELSFFLEPYKILNPYLIGSIGIKNTGNTILDTFKISKSNPDLTKYVDYIENNTQAILLPEQSYRIKFNIPSEDVESDLFAVMGASSGTEEIEEKYIKEDLEIIKDHTNLNMFSKLLSILIFILSLAIFYFISKKVKLRHG